MPKKIYRNVKLGKKVEIGDFCVVGLPPKGAKDGELATVIGDGAQIRSHTIIYAGNKIGRGFQTGHQVMIRENNNIGNDVSIGTGTCLEHHVTIGDRVRIHSGAFVPEFSILEDDSWLGPQVVLTNAKYPRSNKAKDNLRGPHIKEKAKIGANATILPGKVIGENSLVGAGAVVVKDVPAGAIVAGNPAKIIASIKEKNEY